MFAMTGVAMAAYLLRIVRDVVSRNPRFRRALGDVSLVSSNQISFGNLQVLVNDIQTEGTRQSFDYFISTLSGRAILTQVGDKDGSFVEWVTETDVTNTNPPAGVYYLNIDAIDERTRDITLTMESYRWYEGGIKNAQGTLIAFAPGIDITSLDVTDTATGLPVAVEWLLGGMYLLSTSTGLTITGANGPLTPMTDFWVQQNQTQVLIQSTIFGTQTAQIPSGFLTTSLTNQQGYTLRPNIDYIFLSPSVVQLSPWTAADMTISVSGAVALNPTVAANLLNPENLLNITLLPGESLVTDQVFVSTQTADNIQLTVSPSGTLTLPAPLPPGGWCTYDLRILQGQSQVVGKKNAVNAGIIPGLRIAIGDQTIEGDQCAIIVSPYVTQTYEVYGSKPGVTFNLEIKANDPTTADEISKMLLQELLIERRESIDSDGLTLFEASSSIVGTVRDDSGTAPTYTVTLSFSAMADWRVFKPLVTRIRNFNVNVEPYTTTPYLQYPKPTPRWLSCGMQGFLPGYR
jgi:hypothetical protein